jgi:NTE family protein
VEIGLVLGAGGVLGGAWLVGGLRALERATGWTAANVSQVVATSSGALVGGLIAAGTPARDLLCADGPRILAEVVQACRASASTSSRRPPGTLPAGEC